MNNQKKTQRESVVDAYLASCPDLCVDDPIHDEEIVPKRYSQADRDRLLDSILSDDESKCHARPQVQSTLWIIDDDSQDGIVSASAQPSSFFDHVVAAYLAVYDGYSIDRLIADRQRNSLFVSKCWSMGLKASPKELNHALLNARKANRVGSNSNVERFFMSATRMYLFLFASEIATRRVQDDAWLNLGKYVSIDQILCDTKYSDAFAATARELAPGFSEFEYRWAAITIRKNKRRGVRKAIRNWVDHGVTSDVRPSRLPDEDGFYWFQRGNTAIYMGHAHSIREQVDRLMQQGGARSVFPQWMMGETREPMRLAVATSSVSAISTKETMKNDECAGVSPLFNASFGDGLPRDPQCA